MPVIQQIRVLSEKAKEVKREKPARKKNPNSLADHVKSEEQANILKTFLKAL